MSRIFKVNEWEDFRKWRSEQNQTVVFTNGCFDLLHLGHVDYLQKARGLGAILVIGLNSDASVQNQGKGPERPLVGFEGRAGVLAALRCVDAVVEFDSETPLKLIELARPDVLVKGGDYSELENNPSSKDYIVGKREVEAFGGVVKTIPFLPGYSTTSVVNKIKNHA